MAVTTEHAPGLTPADRRMLQILRLPEEQSGSDAEARSAFQASIVVSSIRCLLTYIVLPFVAPTIGFLAKIGPGLSIAVGLVAVVSIISSMRRFWRVRHGQRWAYTTLGGLMLCFICFLLVRDVIAL